MSANIKLSFIFPKVDSTIVFLVNVLYKMKNSLVIFFLVLTPEGLKSKGLENFASVKSCWAKP